MTILLLGGGGREHALGWSLARSGEEVVTLPGNPGLAGIGRTLPGDPTDALTVTRTARTLGCDLVVVGPEAPLAAGVTDSLRAAGVPVVGPGRAAARLESSKSFAKRVMDAAGVATAAAGVFDRPGPAHDYLRTRPGPYVVKADGLAAGKGVLVTDDEAEAAAWIDRCFGGSFGSAGDRIVIEEYLDGPEVSVFALCDGATAVPFGHARDHKRLLDGDAGPNTGGMGCFTPVADVPEELVADTMRSVVGPVLAAMAEVGTPFSGFLYAGMVLTRHGPRVLEFNVRLGDPEAQVLLPLLETPLGDLLRAAAGGDLSTATARFSSQAAVDVVLAAAGYPEAPRRGDPISGLDEATSGGALVFHAGTELGPGGGTVTSGGRVLNVVGAGPTIEAAREIAYAAASVIDFPGKQMRSDIGGRP